MKYLKTYNEKKNIDLEDMLIDLFDMGFEPEIGGLDQTSDFKKSSGEDLILAIKMIKLINHDKDFGYFSGSFDKKNFNLPSIVKDGESERSKFTDFEKDLLSTMADSASKIINLYLDNSNLGEYIVNQYGVINGTCVVMILKFFK